MHGKEFETKRDGEAASGYPDVDISITTRELARMIESAGIYFKHLPDEEFDNPFGESTGAATIFGATGGVMEAALRTAVKLITGAEAPSPEFNDVRGMKNIKEAQYEVGGLNVKVAVASGTKNAGYLMDKIKDGTGDYTFIEIMGVPRRLHKRRRSAYTARRCTQFRRFKERPRKGTLRVGQK